MKRSKHAVVRWRMARQASRRKSRWLESQSRRYRHIYCIRKLRHHQHRHSAVYTVAYEWCA